MEDGFVDTIVIVALVIDVAITITLLFLYSKSKRKLSKISEYNENMKNKLIITVACNTMLKSSNEDYKRENLDLKKKLDVCRNNLQELELKLSNTTKKIKSFSKMVNDMKDS